MLLIVLRKMLNNRWMFICLLIGSILVAAMVSSVPIYSDGVLQRMLTRDLENYQQESNIFPGTYLVSANLSYVNDDANRIKAYELFDSEISDNLSRDFNLPLKADTERLVLKAMNAEPLVQREEKPPKRFMTVEGLQGIEDHIKITHGRMFSTKKEGDVYEAIVTEETMKSLRLLLDEVYVLTDLDPAKPSIKVKVTGVFTVSDPEDAFWYKNLSMFDKSAIIDYNLLVKDFISSGTGSLTYVEWYYGFDYHKISLKNAPRMVEAFKEHKRWASEYGLIMQFQMPAVNTLEQYLEREKQLQITLWVLLIPILLMLSFYIFMVSQLIVNHEEVEIAVFKSRGASNGQVFRTYLMESFILSGIALVIGPPIGMLFCAMLGSANGFMEFVQRTALPIGLSLKAYLYSLISLSLFIVSMLIPVLMHARKSIVDYKREKARVTRAPFWKRFLLDFLILGVAGYGVYRYKTQQNMLNITGAKLTEMQIDPLLFLISTFFVLGAGLLFLRFYPYLIRLIFWIGRKLWSPVLYVSFIQVGRSGGQEQFLMLFIILALSTGLFNANAARTINRNMEDRIMYTTGADISLLAHWDKEMLPGASSFGPSGPPQGISGAGGGGDASEEVFRYIEPPFDKFANLYGVEEATKVLVKSDARAHIGTTWVYNVKVMGIIPDEFGRVAWFRETLLPYHWYHLLNYLAEEPRACLISSSIQKELGIRQGDSISIRWNNDSWVDCVVYGFVDYWPGFEPYVFKDNPSAAPGTEKKPVQQNLIVANLVHIQNLMPVEPYEVWIRKKPGVADSKIDEDIQAKKLQLDEIRYSNQQIIKAKNDPMLQGTNGALTLGFIVSMAIATIGFLIFWILSIQKRVLQFGIFRAMGLTLRKVIGLIICEQILISGVAIFTGIIIGGITSDLFVPLLQMVYSATEQILPFKVVASGSDYIKIYLVITLMLITGFLVLGRIISRIKIDQAVKLGED